MENSLTDKRGAAEDRDLLSVSDLVQMFEDAEEASQTSRKLAERDRDYYDNKQLTDEEKAVLRKRGQPEVIINRIKRKIDFLVGLEKQQRVRPKALPRTPVHEQDADGASQALAYVTDEQDYGKKRSGVWRNMLIEGAGGIAIAVEATMDRSRLMGSTAYTPAQSYRVVLRRVAWDRMFADPHSADPDFEDASYKGVVVWMDYDEAVAKYKGADAKAALDFTLAEQASLSETYDDKPKWRLWADKKRKRVRIVQIWVRRSDEWYYAEFTKGGILKAGRSPYTTDKGESDCELVFQSAYVDRDNDRYGVVREMISPQDEINKRRSKSLHLLSTDQTTYEDGAIEDVEEYRRQRVRPDGIMKVRPNALAEGRIKSETRLDLAEPHLQLLQEAKLEIDLMGPNAAMQGDQPDKNASGKALIASQQGGMIEMGDLLDNLRHFDTRVFRAIWYRVRQFWTAPMWLRVTDDERNLKWVGINVPGDQMQLAAQQNPAMAGKVSGTVSSVAELDCDISIEDAPDSVTPQLEQWQALVELAKSGVPIPPDVLIEAAPNLKNKQRLLERMQQPDPAARKSQELQLAEAAAKIDETKSKTLKNIASAHAEMRPEPQQQPVQPQHRPPSIAVNYKDMPPDAQAQALAQDGIYVHPQVLAVHAERVKQDEANRAAQLAALKSQARTPVQPAK
jgi:hypothetical protein